MNIEQAERTLLEVGRVLDSCGMPFFLSLGTCLGVVRDGRLIAHDTDIDIGCLVEDIKDRAEEIGGAFAASGFESRIVTTPCPFPRAVVVQRDGVKVDIAGYLTHGSSRYCPSSFRDYCLVYPAMLLETTEDVEYLGRRWRVPSPTKEYLLRHYGPGWTTPNPQYRPKDGCARVYGYFKKVTP